MKFIICFVFLIFIYKSYAVDSVTVLCKKAASGTKGTMVITGTFDSAPTSVFATGKSTSCSTLSTTATDDDNLKIVIPTPKTGPYIISIDVTKTGTDAANHDTACGVTDKTVNSQLTSAVQITVKYDARIEFITNNDKLYKASCNWVKAGTVTNEFQTSQAAVVDPTINDAAAPIIDGKVEVHCTDKANSNNNQAKRASITLKDTCSIVATIQDTKKEVKIGKITDVYVHSTAVFDPSTQVQLYSGECGIAASTLTKATDGFSIDTVFNTANVDQYRVKSSIFNAFKYPNLPTVHFKATMVACVLANDPTCTQKSNCAKKRKRRNIKDNQEANNITAEFTTLVTIVSDTQRQIPDSQTRDKPSMAACLTHVTFLSVIVVLSILLLLTLGVTVFFGMKLMKNRYPDKHGYPNPSYKA